MSTLSPFQAGSIKIDNISIQSLPSIAQRKLRKKMGMIFQQFALLERKTVFENIALPLQCWHASRQEIKEKVENLAALVGLTEKLTALPRELSGGQKQRVAIARALALDPSYLFCDEATSALDPRTTQSILELLQEIHTRLNLTIVIVTHEMEVIQRMCTTMSILSNGEIVESGSVLDRFLHPSPILTHLLGNPVVFTAPPQMTILLLQLISTQMQNHILYNLSHHLASPYTLLDAKFTTFQAGKTSTLTLQISTKDMPSAVQYLQSQSISYIILSKGAD